MDWKEHAAAVRAADEALRIARAALDAAVKARSDLIAAALAAALEGAPEVQLVGRGGEGASRRLIRVTKTRLFTVNVRDVESRTSEWTRAGRDPAYASWQRQSVIDLSTVPPEILAAETWEAPNWAAYVRFLKKVSP